MTVRKTVTIIMVTAIITAAVTIGAAIYLHGEKNVKIDDESECQYSLEQTDYGAFASYKLTADRDGVVRSSDGQQFLVNGESVTEFHFTAGTFILIMYDGAIPEVSK